MAASLQTQFQDRTSSHIVSLHPLWRFAQRAIGKSV
jgi:hypothetical protein